MRISAVLIIAIVSMVFILTFTQAYENSNIRIFKNNDLLSKSNIGQKDKMQEFTRFLANVLTDKDIEKVRRDGCKIIHKLDRKISFECPKSISPHIRDAKKVRVFHITDLDADMQIGANMVWSDGVNGSGVSVVVLDTGVDQMHPELSHGIKSCISFVSGEDCKDYNGHGTHVAGIITGDGINTVDGNKATGVSPGADIYMLKVCGSDGYCYEDDMMAAMEYAVYNLSAKIMSISIGGGDYGSYCNSDPLAAKVNWVVDNGYTVIVASGNDGSGVSSPACASKAISVGAIDSDGIVADWSNYGSALDIVAPGVSILSTYSCIAAGDCSSVWYAYMSGTSMSTPHVAGTIALLLDTNPSVTTSQIKDALYSTADPATCKMCRWEWFGKCYGSQYVQCPSDKQGAGIVNTYKAYKYIESIAPQCTQDRDCDDGNYCNGAETCNLGVCKSGVPIDCSSMNNQCNVGVCDEVTDSCMAKPKQDGVLCDDGLFCTIGDECISGVCTGGHALDCDDENACTIDSCDENTDACVNTNLPDGVLCDDGLFCTIGGECTGGMCKGVQRTCSDNISCTIDSCDENTDACVNEPKDSLCDDGLFCNGNEICNSIEGCQDGNPPSCDDGNACTMDSCIYDIDGCSNTPVEDGTSCTGGICCNGVCNNPACTVDADCDDENACTMDSCINQSSCTSSCTHEPVDACVDNDGCCPEGCNHANDNDCMPTEIKCWDARNKYLVRSDNQLKKFCKCAEGEYGYRSYSGRWLWSAYGYIDAGDNENWEISHVSSFYPVYKVRCLDGMWYYANKKYYRK